MLLCCTLLHTCTAPSIACLLSTACWLHVAAQLLKPSLPCCLASCRTFVHKLAMSAVQVAGPGTEWCSRRCKATTALLCMPAGNVARFINHSCKGNLVIQPVFTHGCNGLLYRIALFASEEIAAHTELTYDYGYAEGVVHNRLMVCKCGSQHCRKRLL